MLKLVAWPLCFVTAVYAHSVQPASPGWMVQDVMLSAASNGTAALYRKENVDVGEELARNARASKYTVLPALKGHASDVSLANFPAAQSDHKPA